MSHICDKFFRIFYTRLKTLLKIFAFVVLVASLIVICVIHLDVGVPSKLRRNLNLTSKQLEVKTILYWTGMFNSKTFFLDKGDIFRDCEISACRATHHRSFTRIEEFDALLFHGLEIRVSDIPQVRSPKQKYVFVDLESPANYALDVSYIPDEFFNWTMSYRRDSDIPWAYGYLINSITKDVAYPIWARTNTAASSDAVVSDYLHSPENTGRFEGKRKTVAWFVSHCRTTGLRDRYVKELQKYIDVDIYGDCGPFKCDSGNECNEMLERSYHFYIAFENSLCQDYVTEKMYRSMRFNVVPIVYGAVNYSEVAPPGSYINVADFQGPKHLATHLHHLIDNPEEYEKFFWWKDHFYVHLEHRPMLCKLCEMLHDEKSLAPSNISDIKTWWSKGKCLEPVRFLEKVLHQ